MRWLDGITNSIDMNLGKLGQRPGGLECCSAWGFKESDMTWQLNNKKIFTSLFPPNQRRKPSFADPLSHPLPPTAWFFWPQHKQQQKTALKKKKNNPKNRILAESLVIEIKEAQTILFPPNKKL